jgi:hypothetical protein
MSPSTKTEKNRHLRTVGFYTAHIYENIRHLSVKTDVTGTGFLVRWNRNALIDELLGADDDKEARQLSLRNGLSSFWKFYK